MRSLLPYGPNVGSWSHVGQCGIKGAIWVKCGIMDPTRAQYGNAGRAVPVAEQRNL